MKEQIDLVFNRDNLCYSLLHSVSLWVSRFVGEQTYFTTHLDAILLIISISYIVFTTAKVELTINTEDTRLKIVSLASVGIIALSIVACTNGNKEKSPGASAPQKMKFHGEMKTTSSPVDGTPVLKSLKDNHLEVSSTKTIGEAFDSYKYATKKEWRETAVANGPYYIDYICWLDISPVSSVALKTGIVKRAMEIKFAVREDGETYISLVTLTDTKTDGMIYTTHVDPPGIKKIVTAVYENREIVFEK